MSDGEAFATKTILYFAFAAFFAIGSGDGINGFVWWFGMLWAIDFIESKADQFLDWMFKIKTKDKFPGERGETSRAD